MRVRVAPAGSLRTQLEWNSRCAALAGLRHPAISPLIDYGMADAHRTFEAYLACDAIRTDPWTGARLMNHAVRFLAAHDVYLAPEMANYVFADRRRRGTRASATGRHRAAAAPVHSTRFTTRWRQAVPPGASAVAVTGEPNSGLRTLQVAAARTARLEGYVPLAASLLRQHRWIARRAARPACLCLSQRRRTRTAGGRRSPRTPRRRRRSTSRRAVVRSWRINVSRGAGGTNGDHRNDGHGLCGCRARATTRSALRCGTAVERSAGRVSRPARCVRSGRRTGVVHGARKRAAIRRAFSGRSYLGPGATTAHNAGRPASGSRARRGAGASGSPRCGRAAAPPRIARAGGAR